MQVARRNVGEISFGAIVALLILVCAVVVAEARGASKAQNRPTESANTAEGTTGKEPVLLHKEKLDVDGDGVDDTVAYFDGDGDGIVDGEAIDLGSTGKVSILAIRGDADGDGKDDDWFVVNAETEEVRAALVDENDDGQVETIAFANGKREAMTASATGITTAFRY